MSEPHGRPDDQLMREAAGWFARMRGPEADADRGAFEAWLRRGALHRAAYNRAAEIFALGKSLSAEPQARSSRRSARKAAAAVAAALLLALVAWLALAAPRPGHGDSTEPAHALYADGSAPLVLRTEGRAARSFVLADGSQVLLRPDSLLEVALGPDERGLRLLRGSGRFSVRKEARPFVVHAGQGRVIARGTVFDVTLAKDAEVIVRLIEGLVDVKLTGAGGKGEPQAKVTRLSPGMTLSFAAPAGDGRPPRTPQSAAPEAAADPQPGTVRAFDAVPLGQLVAEANRGSPRPILLMGAGLQERRVSGVFRIDDTALLAERLATLFGLRLDRSRPEVLVLTAS